METMKVVNVEGKTSEQIKHLQIEKIIKFVEPHPFIYDEHHKDFNKKGKRSFFWFQTTNSLNEMFPNHPSNHRINFSAKFLL